MNTKHRPSGIEGLGDMSWGTHFCLFYETKEDLQNVLIPYFKVGLENNEFFLCVASPPLSSEEARRAMRESVPDFERYLAEGQIEFVSNQDWLLTGGQLDAQRVIENWIAKLNWALAKGYAGLRFIGDPSWLDKQAWGSVPEFEKQLDQLVGNSQMLGLCAYALERCSARDILDIVNHHQFTVAKRNGVWEHLEGSELKRAHDEIRQLNTELELRVAERTTELSSINEQLKTEIAERKLAEDRLRLVIDTIPAMVFTALPDGSVDYVNQQMLHYMGLSLENVQGSNWDIPVHPEDRARSVDNWRSTVAVGQSGENELRVRRADGVYRWILGRFVPLRDEMGNIVKWYGVSTDIDDRKRAEEALRAREQEFRAIVENAPDQIIRYDRNLHRLYVNPAVTKDYDLPKEMFVGKLIGSIVADAGLVVDAEEVDAQKRRIQAVFDTGEPIESEVTWPLPDGRRTYLSRLFPEFDSNGEVISVLGIARDITERKRAEEALRKSERVLREAEVLGHTGSWEQDLVTGEIFNTEENLRLFFGKDRSKGTDFEDYSQVVHPDDREYVLRRRVELLEEEGPSDIEYRVVWPDGSVHVIFGRATVVRNELGQPIRVYGTNVDITERKQAEDELRTQKEILQKIFDHTPMMIGMIGVEGQWQMINRAWERTIGWRLEEIQQPNFDVLAEVYSDPGEHQRVMDFIAAKSGKWEEFKARARDGRALDVTFTNVYLSDGTTLGFGLDITERKRAEEDTKRQATRAETLARIAARLNKQLDLDAVIQAVCEEAVNTFQVSQATMSLYDEKRDLLVYAGGVNIQPEYAATMEPITRSRFDDFLRTMGPIMVVPDIQALPDVPNAEFSARLDVRTVVTAAMFRDQELVGALVLGVNGHVREFDKDELTLLKAISDQAAQAIANALLLRAANEQHEQLRALSTKLVETQETERRALTTELHDRVGQNLTGLSINLQNMKALLSDETAQTLAMKFDDAQALVEHITRQMRDIMAELHPPELEDYGLAVALETYAERAASRGNLELIADLPDFAPPPLPSDISIALFRAAQEAISNVLKHANATQLEVRLEERDGSVLLSVEDNGQGFEPEAASQKEAPTWGLKIMRQRIESIGGKVQIESEPGRGTRVTFEVERQS